MVRPRPERTAATTTVSSSPVTAELTTWPSWTPRSGSATRKPRSSPLEPREQAQVVAEVRQGEGVGPQEGRGAQPERARRRGRRRVREPVTGGQSDLAAEVVGPGGRERPAGGDEAPQRSLQVGREPAHVAGEQDPGVPGQARPVAAGQGDVGRHVVASVGVVQPGHERRGGADEARGQRAAGEHPVEADRVAAIEQVGLAVAVLVDPVAPLPRHHRQHDEDALRRARLDGNRDARDRRYPAPAASTSRRCRPDGPPGRGRAAPAHPHRAAAGLDAAGAHPPQRPAVGALARVDAEGDDPAAATGSAGGSDPGRRTVTPARPGSTRP